MHDAVRGMLEKYNCRNRDDYINALREILQEVTPFVRDPHGLEIWSKEFFSRIIERIVAVDEISV